MTLRSTSLPVIIPIKEKKMANDNHLLSDTCYNVAMQKHNCYKEFFELGQQKINFNFYELSETKVHLLKKS